MVHRKYTIKRPWRVFHSESVTPIMARSSLEVGAIFIRNHPGVRMDNIKEGLF